MNRHCTKVDTQMANEHLEKYSTPSVTREMQIKATLKHHFTPVEMGNTQTDRTTITGNIKCW